MVRVLVAVDGSPQSFDAVGVIEHLSLSAPPVALHVVTLPEPGYLTVFPDLVRDIHGMGEQELRAKGKAFLERIDALLPTEVGPVENRIETGHPAEIILQVAREQQVDLIVMGARGLGSIEEAIFGSVSQRVLIESKRPTLIVKRPMPLLQRILLPLEGIDDVDAAWTFLEKKPFRSDVQFTVLTVLPLSRNVWPLEIPVSEAHMQKALDAAKDFVDGFASKLSALGYGAEGIVTLGAPGIAILQMTEETQSDLILMGSHGRRGLARFALGSVSHAVLHKAHTSVGIFRIEPAEKPS